MFCFQCLFSIKCPNLPTPHKWQTRRFNALIKLDALNVNSLISRCLTQSRPLISVSNVLFLSLSIPRSLVYCVDIFVLIRVFMSARERHILKFNQHKQYSNESRVTETGLKTSMFACEFNFVKCFLHVCVCVCACYLVSDLD